MFKKIAVCGAITIGITFGGGAIANAAEPAPEIDLEKALIALCELADTGGITVETEEGLIEFTDGADLTEAAEENPELIDQLLEAQEPVFLQALLMDEPTDPIEPVDPVDPVEPVDPIDPVEPVDPVDPIDPVDPVEPVKPVPPVVPEPTPNPEPGPAAPAPAPVPQPTYAGDSGAAAPVVYGNSGYAGTGDQLAFTGGAGSAGIVTAALAALSAGGFMFTRGRKTKTQL